MKKIFKPLAFLVATLLIGLLAGCSNPGLMGNGYVAANDLPQIDYNIDKLRNIPYMGGSLIYSETNEAVSHLQAGMKVPFRLGEVEVVYDAEMQENTFADIADRAKLGYLTINSIDGEHIAFSYVVYNSEGKRVKKGSLTLTRGEEADLDRDGDMDISFCAPQRSRSGFDGVTLLKFLSSQAELSTSMYSLLEEQFADSSYPSGIMGLNPDESLLLNSRSLPTRSRSVTAEGSLEAFDTYGEQGIVEGDFVMNAHNGRYSTVSTITTSRSGGIAVELDGSNKSTVFSALPLLYFNYDSLIDLSETVDEQAEGGRGEISNFHRYRALTLLNINKKFDLKGGGYINLRQLKARLGLKATGSASWSRVRADVKTVIYVTSAIDANIKQITVSKNLSFPIAVAKQSIALGPVIITVGGGLVAGADIKAQAKGSARLIFRTGALAGAGSGVNAGVKWKKVWFARVPVGIYCRFSKSVIRDFSFKLDHASVKFSEANVSARVYAGLRGEVTLWESIYVNTTVSPEVTPTIIARKNGNRITVTGTLDGGVSAGDLRIGARIWKFNPEKRFGPLFKYSRRLWSKVLYKNY